MKKPQPSPAWPDLWHASYRFDLQEVFDEADDIGFANAYAERAGRAIRAIEEVARPPARVLDIAAAQGNFSLRLAERGYDVTWNDLRSAMAGYVQLKHEHGQIEYAPGNCFELHFPAPFDVVLITEIIEHVAHPDEFLRNAASLVRPGGHVVMTTPNGRYFRNKLPKFSECADASKYEAVQFKPDADGHIFLLHPEEVEKLAVDTGLRLTRLDLFTNPLTRGALRLYRLHSVLPPALVKAVERVTSVRHGMLLPWLNMHLLAVFQRPLAS